MEYEDIQNQLFDLWNESAEKFSEFGHKMKTDQERHAFLLCNHHILTVMLARSLISTSFYIGEDDRMEFFDRTTEVVKKTIEEFAGELSLDMELSRIVSEMLKERK